MGGGWEEIHARTHTHTQTRTHIHTHTYTHTRTHTQKRTTMMSMACIADQRFTGAYTDARTE